MQTSDIETLIALRLTIYSLLIDINRKIEELNTYEDDNFKITIDNEMKNNQENNNHLLDKLDDVCDNFYVVFYHRE